MSESSPGPSCTEMNRECPEVPCPPSSPHAPQYLPPTCLSPSSVPHPQVLAAAWPHCCMCLITTKPKSSRLRALLMGTPLCLPWLSCDNRVGEERSNWGRFAVDSEGSSLGSTQQTPSAQVWGQTVPCCGGARVLSTSLPPPTRCRHDPLPLCCVVKCPLGQMLTWSQRGGRDRPKGGGRCMPKGQVAQGRKDDLAVRGWGVLLETGQEKVRNSGEGREGHEGRSPGPNLSLGWGLRGGACTPEGPGGARQKQNHCTFKSNPVGGWGPLSVSPSGRSRGWRGLHCSEAEGRPLSSVLCFGGAATWRSGPMPRGEFLGGTSHSTACLSRGRGWRPCRSSSRTTRQPPSLGFCH